MCDWDGYRGNDDGGARTNMREHTSTLDNMMCLLLVVDAKIRNNVQSCHDE